VAEKAKDGFSGKNIFFWSVCSLMMVELSWPMRKAEEMFLSQNLFSRHKNNNVWKAAEMLAIEITNISVLIT
jgi:hypothetical protein